MIVHCALCIVINCGRSITETDFGRAAVLLDCESAALKAVQKVETGDEGGCRCQDFFNDFFPNDEILAKKIERTLLCIIFFHTFAVE